MKRKKLIALVLSVVICATLYFIYLSLPTQIALINFQDGQLAENKERFKGHLTTIAAAYYNLGASFEHLGKLDLALCAFHKGLNYC